MEAVAARSTVRASAPALASRQAASASASSRASLIARPSRSAAVSASASISSCSALSASPLTVKDVRSRKDSSRRAGVARAQAADGEVAAVPAAPAPSKKFLGVEVITLKKVIPLGIIFFCILFNYTILRDTKDVLVVTAPGSGAEIIPFLKTWVNLPMAVGIMVLYGQLANVLPKETLFYTCIIPFLAFFGSFAFILYPMRDVIHPTKFSEQLLATLGPRFMGPISILRNWSFCLFYVMAELWGSVVVSVLFWGFANQVCLRVIQEKDWWQGSCRASVFLPACSGA